MPHKKIGFLTPFFSQNRGNATTAKRLKAGLSEARFIVEIFAYEEDVWHEEVKDRLATCELLHILHFDRFITWKQTIRDFPNLPYVVTAGGTDLYYKSDRFSDVHDFLRNAEKIVVFSNEGKERLEATFSLKGDQIAVIPQSVWFPTVSERSENPMILGYPRLLLPAGLRPVKDVLFLLEPLLDLQKHVYPTLKWVILGPILDQAVYNEVKQSERTYDWLIYKSPVPLSEIPNWYNWADVVLNSSRSEGQSSALLEAMSLKVPVLARKIPGNESVVTDLDTGLLFSNKDEFSEKLQLLLSNAELKNRIRQKGKEWVEHHHALKKEIADYIAIYNQVKVNHYF